MKPLPCPELLRSKLKYDPETGELWWKENQRLNAGKKAGYLCNGYLVVKVGGRIYKAHRLIWCHYYGEDPGDLTIDHTNRVKTDNRISNLRKANTCLQNNNRGGATAKKPVRIIFPDGRGALVVDSISTAGQVLNIMPTSIANNLRYGRSQLYWGQGSTNPSGIRLEYA